MSASRETGLSYNIGGESYPVHAEIDDPGIAWISEEIYRSDSVLIVTLHNALPQFRDLRVYGPIDGKLWKAFTQIANA